MDLVPLLLVLLRATSHSSRAYPPLRTAHRLQPTSTHVWQSACARSEWTRMDGDDGMGSCRVRARLLVRIGVDAATRGGMVAAKDVAAATAVGA